MTAQAPTDARLDRIAAMAPWQHAQHQRGRATIANVAAQDHAAAVAATEERTAARARATLGYASAEHVINTAHRLTLTARDYARCAANRAKLANIAAHYASTADTMTERARSELHIATWHADAADDYADAVRAIRHAAELAEKAEREITQ